MDNEKVEGGLLPILLRLVDDVGSSGIEQQQGKMEANTDIIFRTVLGRLLKNTSKFQKP